MIDLITPAGITILIVGVVAKLLNSTALSNKKLPYSILTLMLVFAAFIPFFDYSVFNVLYGVVGFLSFPTLVLISFFTLRQFGLKKSEFNPLAKTFLALSSLLIAALMYPSATGFIDTDFYSFGYAYPFSILFVLFIFLSLLFKQSLLALIYILSWLSWLIELNTSPNGFDYMLDFWLVVWSLVVLTSQLIRKLKRSS
jgi:hypothetical protein